RRTGRRRRNRDAQDGAHAGRDRARRGRMVRRRFGTGARPRRQPRPVPLVDVATTARKHGSTRSPQAPALSLSKGVFVFCGRDLEGTPVRSQLQKAAAVLLTVAIFALILRRVPFPALAAALRDADHATFLALMIPNTLFYFAWDTLVLTVVIGWFHGAVAY